MFNYCVDPKALADTVWLTIPWLEDNYFLYWIVDFLNSLPWFSCYLTSPKHLDFYWSFVTVLALLAITAPAALGMGFLGATVARSHFRPLSLLGKIYIWMVRGVPDIIFFLFFVIALDQGLEYIKSLAVCDGGAWPWQGLEFRVCQEAKVPLAKSSPFWHQAYGFMLAVVTFAIVFGAFVANVIYGAMNAVPRAQLETAEAYGMNRRQVFRRILVPQMWVYALPGLGNLWMILIKATPLLFLLGVKDIVYYARELGGSKTQAYEYPHGDWRLWYFLGLMIFYLVFTKVSEIWISRLTRRLSHGQATSGGEALRKAAA